MTPSLTFGGEWKRKLDKKSRLLIPRPLIRILEETYLSREIIVAEFPDCLHLYPAAIWPMQQSILYEHFSQDEARSIIGSAYRATIQQNGRFQIKYPQYRLKEDRDNLMRIIGATSSIRIERYTKRGSQIPLFLMEENVTEPALHLLEGGKRQGRGRPVKPGHIIKVNLKDLETETGPLDLRQSLDVKDLIKSIEKEGQKFPIYIRGPKPYKIIAGRRRVAAMRMLSKDTIKAIVFPRMGEGEAQRLALIDNMERSSLSDADLVLAIGKLHRRGISNEEIAKLLRRKVRTVQRLLKLSKAPLELIDRIRDGSLSVSAAYEIYSRNIPLDEVVPELQANRSPSVRELQKFGRKSQEEDLAVQMTSDGFNLNVRFRKGGSEDHKREVVQALNQALKQVWAAS